MELSTWLVLVAAVVAWAVWRQRRLVSARKAVELLRQGAKVIDVRTPAEYGSGHLPGTLNVPLDELRQRISKVAPDPRRPLLLHCLSGTRSGMARRLLQRLGYTQVYNLGSYFRAQRILRQAQPEAGRSGPAS